MKTYTLLALVCLSLLTPTLFGQTNAPAVSPSDQLHQLTAQLQTSPDDTALRGRIIALAQTIAPAPALPDEAERRMARGTEAFKEAKSTADFQDAVKEFQQATLAAPWSGDAYFNLGLAQDKAGDYAGSLASLKLAQLASPGSKDIKDLYYRVEYQRDKAAEQNSAAAKQQAVEQEAAAAEEKNKQDFQNNIGFLAGTWNSVKTAHDNGHQYPWQVIITITGRNILIADPRGSKMLNGTIVGEDLRSIKWVRADETGHLPDSPPVDVTINKAANQINWTSPVQSVDSSGQWFWSLSGDHFQLTR
jgi:hypothetical protein